MKPSEVAGALAFRLCGLRQGIAESEKTNWPRAPFDVLFWLAFAVTLFWSISNSRGGMVSIAAAAFVVMLFGFGLKRMILMSGVAVLVLGVMSMASVSIATDHREISVGQIFDNAESILSGESYEGSGDLGSNMRWRLRWWGEIVDDVVFGDAFWRGRGFGINLASADRIQMDPDPTLRNPHSSHMTFLARAGVPGLLLWVVLQVGVIVSLSRRAIGLRKAGKLNWQKVNVWILAYWMASLVNGSFDVYLEGPQGGIWFWVLTGVALALPVIEDRVFGRTLLPERVRG